MIRSLACLLFVSAALAAPQGYQAPAPIQQTYQQPCGSGLIRKADGSCAKPIVSRNLYLYNAPAQKVTYGPAPYIPDPKIHYNYVFVRTQNAVAGQRPVVVGPAQQKTLVYLLNKRPAVQSQQLIEVPSNPTQPEVFFVNYNEGDNPQLPGGIDLQTALSQSAANGQVISGSGFGSDEDSHEGGFVSVGGSGSGIGDIRGGIGGAIGGGHSGGAGGFGAGVGGGYSAPAQSGY